VTEVQEFNRPSDLKDWAYSKIKQLILTSQVKAGEQLRIETLSGKMGISRTPIREALLKLEGEGLVRTASRVGFFVKGLTKRDLRELFELREIIEAYAAEKAAPCLSDDDILYLSGLHKKAVEAVKSNQLEVFVDLETTFHTFIIESSDNQRLLKVLESLKDLTYRERILSVQSIENVAKSLKEHEDIVQVLDQRDGHKAGELMRLHIREVKKRLIEFLDLPDD